MGDITSMISNTVMMPRELTAEIGAKALLSGEFHEVLIQSCFHCSSEGRDEDGEDCEYCDGNGELSTPIVVSWENIKRIYKMAVDNFGT